MHVLRCLMILALLCGWCRVAVAACTGASPTWASTPDRTSLNTCVTNATAGDTIQVSAGSATYTSSIVVSKPLTILGAGDTSTVLTGSGTLVFDIRVSSGAFRLSGFGFAGSGGGAGLESAIIQMAGVEGVGIWSTFRLDHCRFTNITGVNYNVYMGDWWNIPSHPKVLFDHLTVTSATTSFFKMMGNNGTWKLDDQYGTDFFVYIEDSSFSWSSTGGVTDTEHGARFVVRHNTITNGSIQMHDTGSTPAAKGQRATEIYENTITCTSDCSSLPAMGIRGGGYLIYNNTITGNYFTAGYPQIWRAIVGAGYLGGMCDGTPLAACNTSTLYHCSGGDHRECAFVGDSACSGIGSCVVSCSTAADCPTGLGCIANVDRVNGGSDAGGWPCRNQTGWGKESANGVTEDPAPVYWYGNVGAGGSPVFPANPQPAYFVQDRDWCAHDMSTTCGAKASWTYTPLAYPHPLAGGSVTLVEAPKNLRYVIK